jgi:hypothetical protein
MLDWLRYFPLGLGFLQNHKYLTPKGPYFPKLRPQRWQLGDSAFAFKAPWANSVFGAQRYGWRAESRSPGSDDICCTYNLHSYDSDWMPLDRWQYAVFFGREWYFVGPWFSGMRLFSSMSATLMGQTQHNDFHNASFFHPRVFETAIADYLNSSYGLQKMGRKPRYRGPMNWRILPISSSVRAVCFDIYKIEQSIENPNVTRHIIFPISHNRFVKIEFNYGGARLVENSYDASPAFDLSEAIINSFKLEVGPTMQAQWDEVKAYCPDMSLTTEFAELKWPIKPEDVGKVQDPAPVSPQPELLTASPSIKRVE